MNDEQFVSVREALMTWQTKVCAALEEREPSASFQRERYERHRGGVNQPHVLSDGEVFEKAAVNFSHARGDSLPPAATKTRPQLAGKSFEAVSTSLIVHPRNPFVPTSHANLRCFRAGTGESSIWWFGGGFDLTPYYGFEADCVHWHQVAKAACDATDEAIYPQFKERCDQYFSIKHRQEARGIGGLFFDDWNEPDFDTCFGLVKDISKAYINAYMPIVDRRKDTEYGQRERRFQCYRRGRYVEFNLVYDRGTLYGLQSGGRIESILASMPPVVHWVYDWKAEAGSAEEALVEYFLKARNWVDLSDREKH